MLNNRVNPIKSHKTTIFPWFSYGFTTPAPGPQGPRAPGPLRPRHVHGLAHDLGLAIGVLTAPLRAGDLLGQQTLTLAALARSPRIGIVVMDELDIHYI